MGPDASLISELQPHTGGLTTLVGIMGVIIGALLMGAFNYFQKRLGKVEERQEKLREDVIPQLISKDDLKAVMETLEKVGNAFVDRVEKFMTACHSGECSMAVFIKNYIEGAAPESPRQRRTPIRKEAS